MYFIYIITIHFEFDSFQFIKHDLMMMGENAFYVNTTHLLVVLYVVVRKRFKEAIYILKYVFVSGLDLNPLKSWGTFCAFGIIKKFSTKDSQFQTNELKVINFKWLLSFEIKLQNSMIFSQLNFFRESFPQSLEKVCVKMF